jgi:hypothetical protein
MHVHQRHNPRFITSFRGDWTLADILATYLHTTRTPHTQLQAAAGQRYTPGARPVHSSPPIDRRAQEPPASSSAPLRIRAVWVAAKAGPGQDRAALPPRRDVKGARWEEKSIRDRRAVCQFAPTLAQSIPRCSSNANVASVAGRGTFFWYGCPCDYALHLSSRRAARGTSPPPPRDIPRGVGSPSWADGLCQSRDPPSRTLIVLCRDMSASDRDRDIESMGPAWRSLVYPLHRCHGSLWYARDGGWAGVFLAGPRGVSRPGAHQTALRSGATCSAPCT